MTSTQEVDFLEDYILSQDRSKVVGEVYDDDTLDYWYWNLLNAQNKFEKAKDKAEKKKAKANLDEWVSKAKNTVYYDSERLDYLDLRNQIMTYSKKNWEEVCERLEEICESVNLAHEQDKAVVDVKGPDYPSTLQLSTAKLLKQAFKKIDSGEAGIADIFTARACPFLAQQGLGNSDREAFLNLVESEWPDLDGLIDHVVQDLENGIIFGERAIHKKLTRKHLMRLAEKMPGTKKNPGILGDEQFLLAFCQKLRPITDTNLRENRVLLGEYLDELKKFALGQIKDNHASLKALILFNHMKFQESSGEGYSKKVIQEYMKIPKYENVYKPELSLRSNDPQVAADAMWECELLPELDPVMNDEPLIRRAISQFFLDGEKTEPWSPFADRWNYSLPLFAESMLVYGRGNNKFQDAQIHQYEKSYSPPGAYKRLINRVDLEFCPTNKTMFGIDEPVTLEFFCKNNPKVEVYVYDVNAKNYYKEKLNEIPVSLSLSGSASIKEFTLSIEQPPIRRTTESLNLTVLEGRRGVFLVDLIGNGVTTRALIRKGELRFISDQERENSDGYVFKVFNESNEMVKNARIWMDGKDYDSDADGNVSIPFAEDATKEELIILEDLDSKGSSTLQRFRREKPEYTLECGMYIDREQLLKKKAARVIVRTTLFMNNEIVSISNLKNTQFNLTLTDNIGNKKTRIEEFSLYDDKESMFIFTVPTELRQVECVLTAESPTGKPMIAKQVVSVNSSEDTMVHANMYMYRSGAAGYVVAVRGKNGEGYANVPVKLSFKHRHFCQPITEMVQTDANGHIYLGRLPDIDEVEATCDEDFVYSEATFETLTDIVNVPTVCHRAVGKSVKLPFTPEDDSKGPLMYLYDNHYIKDFSKLVKYVDGYITCEGLPAGDFTLYIRDNQSLQIGISISEGFEIENERGEYIIGKNRVLQLSEDEPLQIVSANGDRRSGYVVKLAGYNEMTRVHIVCCSQNPMFNMYGFLASPFCPPQSMNFTSPGSKYLVSHELDSEYNYIMQRKHDQVSKKIGNMLLRPSMLSNRWTSQPTPTRSTDPRAYKEAPMDDRNLAKAVVRSKVDLGSAQKRREGDPSPLEFLGEASYVYANRPVGEDGSVEISADLISENHNIMQILAVDDDNTCLRNVIFQETDENAELKSTDVRLGQPLEAEKHFTEVRRIICLPNNGDDYVIEDFSTAEYEPYETLEEPFNLYRSLSSNLSDEIKDKFMQFEPLIQWHEMSLREKLNFYDRMSCNEVNYFIKMRDEEFFKLVVVPGLQNKIQQTFFDKYLLGMDLSAYKKTSMYSKLNALEQIFLADGLKDDEWTAKTLRNFAERSQLEDIDPREQDEVFDLAINSRQLGVEELERAQMILEAQMVEAQLSAARGDTGGGEDDWQDYLDMTLEYQDAGYYGLPVTLQKSTLIPHTRFWADFALFMLDPSKKADGFLSNWFMMVNSNLNELLCALAVLGLPLQAQEPKRIQEGPKVRVLAKVPVILFVRELVETQIRTSAISVSMNYFDPSERMHVVDGESVDKFIHKNFKTNKVYGSRVVVTNVSSVDQRVEILCQIPQGSIPCGQACFQTKSWSQIVEPYGTYRREFFFYWPEAGQFKHFPVHVNKNGETIGYAKEDPELNVETGLLEPDTSSWRYIANLAEEAKVLEFLTESGEAQSVDLSKICWRFRDNPDFFDSVCEILRSRRIYNERVWAYSLICDQGRGRQELGEFLSQDPDFRNFIYPGIKSKIVSTDNDSQRDYQVMEYWPLQNPRAHEVDIGSTDYGEFYVDFMVHSAFTSTTLADMSMKDKLALTNYLLLRNLITKAKTLFESIDSKKAGKKYPMVYDYMSIYLNFHTGKAEKLKAKAEKYAKMNLSKGQKAKWEQVLEQIDHRGDPSLSDAMFLKRQEQMKLEAMKPHLDFFPQEDGTLLIEHRNISEITVNFYRTELELMFSMYPFQDENVSYKLMRPNMSETLEGMHDGTTAIGLPELLRAENTIVEMVTKTKEGTIKVTKVAYDNQIDVTLSNAVGQVRVLHSETRQPICKAYVKVYAQNIRDRSIQFFKDGYTDIRGRFDYRTLSTDQLRGSKRLAILVSTEEYGSLIKEVEVPRDMQTKVNLLAGLE
jgi:hypothetical protein